MSKIKLVLEVHDDSASERVDEIRAMSWIELLLKIIERMHQNNLAKRDILVSTLLLGITNRIVTHFAGLQHNAKVDLKRAQALHSTIHVDIHK